MSKRPALLLDRDGTINDDTGYVSDPERVELLPDAAIAIAKARSLGFAIIVISNQSGVGRGYFDESTVDRVNGSLVALLKGADPTALVDGFYCCPHSPATDGEDSCDCRKPKPGMIINAAKEHDLDLARSWMVGDKPSDVAAGQRAGTRTVLLAPPGTDSTATLVAADLAAAVDEIALRAAAETTTVGESA